MGYVFFCFDIVDEAQLGSDLGIHSLLKQECHLGQKSQIG